VFGRLSALAAVISLFLVAVAHGATTDTASATASPGTYVVNEPITFTSTTPCTVLCSQIWTSWTARVSATGSGRARASRCHSRRAARRRRVTGRPTTTSSSRTQASQEQREVRGSDPAKGSGAHRAAPLRNLRRGPCVSAPRGASEREERRLALARRCLEAGLPAAAARLVCKQEPQQHRDPRIRARHLHRLREVARLQRGGHAEEAVGRVRLVAVLVDPDRLAAVELGDDADQVTEVAELDGRAKKRLRRRRVGRVRGVRVMRVRVEAARAGLLHRAQERDR
jgi:hypothetical protein